MKILPTTLLILFLQAFFESNAQCVETVNELRIEKLPSCSYIINIEGIIAPPVNGQVVLRGSSPFFLRAASSTYKSPSPEKNFIRTETYRRSKFQLPGVPSHFVKSTRYEYFDGLGALEQSIDVAASPTQGDLIAFTQNDAFGRSPRNHLPYTYKSKSNGAFRDSALHEQISFYLSTKAVAADSSPYAVSIFDDSPLNIVKSSYSYGWRWHTALPSTNIVNVNRAGEVLRFTFGSDGLPLASNSYFPAGTLTISTKRDESGVKAKVFKDFLGTTVCQWTMSGTEQLKTYNIHNERGQLVFVFPPEAMKRISQYQSSSDKQVFLDTWCFQLRYDKFGRIIEKKVPGAGWVYFVYDRWDRVTLSQDPNQRLRNEWSFTKFDIYNRPIATGVVAGTRSEMETGAAANNNRFEERSRSSIGYTNRTFPSHTEQMLLTITYYDDYNFLTYPSWDIENVSLSPRPESGIVDLAELLYKIDPALIVLPIVRGHATARKVKLSDKGTFKWLNQVNYYNRRYQIVQTVSENHLGGTDVVSKKLDPSSGLVQVSLLIHTAPSRPSLSVRETFVYDDQDRLLKVRHRVNDQPEIIMASNKYNEIGQLIEKNLHSEDNTTFLQSIDYRYNIQGWVTHINNSSLSNDGIYNDDTNDLFGLEILFNDSVQINNGAFASRRHYDGNVSAVKWRTNTKGRGISLQERIYGFEYDDFKRFRQSYYAVLSGGAWKANPSMFNEKIVSYDHNGNIGGAGVGGLVRNGTSNGRSTVIDNLSYRYSGNQLQNVRDMTSHKYGFSDLPAVDASIDEYRYDANGNLVEDMNKAITSITYNQLNLPVRIEFTRVSPVRTDEILYAYDALGNKLRKRIVIGGKTVWTSDYINGIRYDNDSLTCFGTSEGRVIYDGREFSYEYFLKDHQSNTRVVCGLYRSTNTFLATMENAMGKQEETVYGFANVSETRSVGNNFTESSDKVLVPDKSARCNGFSTGDIPAMPVGPAKRLGVSSGDVVYAEVYARFNNVRTNAKDIAPAIFAGFVNNAFKITPTENPALYQNMTNQAPLVTSKLAYASNVPKGYLVLMFFDKQSNFIRAQAHGISENAFQSFEKLTLSFTAERDGDVFIYVANESAALASADVFFDDLYIVHESAKKEPQVLQASDYYPLGLPFNQYNKDRLRRVFRNSEWVYEPFVRNRVLFQGQELEKDLGLGWYQFKYRMHDPAIGRFASVDPLAGDYVHLSPYSFSGNNLLNAVELEGLEPKYVFEMMKRFSPVAVKIDLSFNSHETFFGWNISYGLPKSLPFSYRREFGKTYRTYDILQRGRVVESRSAVETSYLFGLVSYQTTTYERPGVVDKSGFRHDTSQKTGMITIGGAMVNLQYENDWQPSVLRTIGDPFGIHEETNTDMFGTAAMSVNAGFLSFGFKLGTGDPGPEGRLHTSHVLGGKAGTYTPYTAGETDFDPNRYRLGLVYFGAGPLQIGINNESNRHLIQNKIVHDHMLEPSPWFQPLPANDQLYFGWSLGTTTQW